MVKSCFRAVVVQLLFFVSSMAVGQGTAFFYQTVGDQIGGSGTNTVQLATTTDGYTIDTKRVTVLEWIVNSTGNTEGGDPTFSFLSNGTWACTKWSNSNHALGQGKILYSESSCGVMEDTSVIVIVEDTVTAGCTDVSFLQIGKTSQIFDVSGSNYVFHSSDAKVHLARISDATQKAIDLKTLCVLSTPVTGFSDLDYGETTEILANDSILFSDCATARRKDGTYVLFAKGIAKNTGCATNSVCEVCARGIWRSTSTDLINWTTPEKVVSECSVPSASTDTSGRVWLYYQDFGPTCISQDITDGARAPMSAVYEEDGTYALSSKVTVYVPEENCTFDTTEHYLTNANPVAISSAAAMSGISSCVSSLKCNDTYIDVPVNSCGSYTWTQNSSTYTQSGNYIDTVKTTAHCDSIITLQLTVTTVDTSTTPTPQFIKANATSVTYQWLNCDNNKAKIMGETGQNYIPNVSGNYAVEVTDGSCVDTSNCRYYEVVVTGVRSTSIAFSVSPNPSEGKFNVQSSSSAAMNYSVTDLTGNVLQSGQFTKALTIDLSQENKGIYLFSCGGKVSKLVKY